MPTYFGRQHCARRPPRPWTHIRGRTRQGAKVQLCAESVNPSRYVEAPGYGGVFLWLTRISRGVSMKRVSEENGRTTANQNRNNEVHYRFSCPGKTAK